MESFISGGWVQPAGDLATIHSAVTGEQIATAGTGGVDFAGAIDYAKTKGRKSLAAMTFHDRARMLKALALHLREHREALYALSHETGATLLDSKIDIDGGIGTLQVYAAKGRREMPDDTIFTEDAPESLSRKGTFLGQHALTPLQGVAVHINAFNFPVWGMLEKLAPTMLAGMPAIVKPATATCFLAEACFRIMHDSGILPEGAVQFVAGSAGNLPGLLGAQDVVGFTGSADTALALRSSPKLLANAVRFMAEQDSLNASVLGPDAAPGTPEFDIFIKEALREITTKAGQKCTATRRLMVPQAHCDAVAEALAAGLGKITIGHPAAKETRMGALASQAQREDVLAKSAMLAAECERVFGNPDDFTVAGADAKAGAFLPPQLFFCTNPQKARAVHETEAFGPVSTLMGYADAGDVASLLNRGGGSLVASVMTHDGGFAREMVEASGAYHGRLYFNNRDSADESTGHGAPMPQLVHGGPGRAGGGEELGGIRAVTHYMQRTAIQGSPDILTAISGKWVKGAATHDAGAHAFRLPWEEVRIGHAIKAGPREITLADIEHFAEFTGDQFYAHMDEAAAAASPFFEGRVAHGYLLLSFAAGMFVDPAPGPVLANTGLRNLSFDAPVAAGDSITVALAVKSKTRRTAEYGEVTWHVCLTNQRGEQVAEYELLTMVAMKGAGKDAGG